MSLTLLSQKYKILTWPLLAFWLLVCVLSFCGSGQMSKTMPLSVPAAHMVNQDMDGHQHHGANADSHANSHAGHAGGDCCEEGTQLSKTSSTNIGQLIVIVSLLITLLVIMFPSVKRLALFYQLTVPINRLPLRVTQCSYII